MESTEIKMVNYSIEEPTLEIIQKIVNGYFTIIPLYDGKNMYVNEEGELRKLKINEDASKIVGFHVFGNVIIVG
tara:strand:- start:228 stop:449 length:222 start_codon:yes stop_codon:yes gene_type:complete